MHRTLVHLAVVIPLAMIVFLFRLGVADWRGDSDAQVAQIIQDIEAGRGWVLPLRNGLHIPDKPPLLSWLGAVSASVRHSGGDTLDARLPSALLATLCVVGVYGFASSLAGAAVALWAALILITTPQFVIAARDSRVDMVFCALLTLGLVLAWRVYEGAAGRRTAWLAGLCIGLATLSKGPLALVLTVLVFGVTAVLVPPAPTWRALIAIPTLAASIGLPALWYFAATVEQGGAFLRMHLLDENMRRLTGGLGEWPVWYYVGPLLTLGLPWTLTLPGAVSRNATLPQRSRRFLWTWVVVMFVFFSLALGKRRAYILPLRPALAILLAAWLAPQLDRLSSRRRPHQPPRAAHAIIASLAIVALVGALALRLGIGAFGASPLQWSYWWHLYLQRYLVSVGVLIIGLCVGADLIVRWLWQRRFDLAAYGLVGVLALGCTIGFSADAIVRGEALSFRPLAARVSADVGPTEPLAFLDVDDELAICLLSHLHRRVPVVQSVDGPGSCTPPAPGAYLITESWWDQRACASNPRWHVIVRGGPEISSHRAQRLVLARYADAAP
jgi:4-amino-4-deoxy-L-arabinose transferase-like glycosyltransferase